MTKAADRAREALASMEKIGNDGWCLCVENGAQGRVESALSDLIAEHDRLARELDEAHAHFAIQEGRIREARALIPEPPTEVSVEEWSAAMDAERVRQIERGYDDAHDREHGPVHLLNWAIDYARRGRNLAAAAMIREAIGLISERHHSQDVSDDDRVALREAIWRGYDSVTSGTWAETLNAMVDAVLASAPWRNRHRGPITDALRDFAEHGLRFDLNPTMAITTAVEVYKQWAAYARRMDQSVREAASTALDAGTDQTERGL